jgi:DNA-binding transcriptional ArsR family regulator
MIRMSSRAEKELGEYEEVFASLSNETRRLILVVLMSRKGEMTAGDIVARFSCRWPTVTRHLNQLVDADLVRVSKVGRERRYILNQEKLQRVVGGWLKWFESN